MLTFVVIVFSINSIIYLCLVIVSIKSMCIFAEFFGINIVPGFVETKRTTKKPTSVFLMRTLKGCFCKYLDITFLCVANISLFFQTSRYLSLISILLYIFLITLHKIYCLSNHMSRVTV